MVHRLLILMALFLAGCQSPQPANTRPDQPAAASQEWPWLVRLEIQTTDQKPRVMRSAGFVVDDGRVVCRLHGIRQAQTVTVRTSAGQMAEAEGVAAYHDQGEIALLDVRWSVAPPPAAPLGRSPGSALLKLSAAPADPAKEFELVPGRANSVGFDCAIRSALDEVDAGGVALDSSGMIAGIPIRTSLAAPAITLSSNYPAPPVGAFITIRATRPEIAAALKPGPTIRWDAWPAQVAAMGRASELADQAESKLRARDHAAARDLAHSAVDADPACWRGWRSLGAALRGLENPEALAAFQHAVDLTPTDAYSWACIAHMLGSADRTYAAKSAADRAIEADPFYAPGHSIKGWLLWNDERLDEAAEEYQLAIKLDPNDSRSKESLDRLTQLRLFPPPARDKTPSR